ncbi:hypothetical protein FY136_28880 (plasmid) [Agrobacterium tumefaciens]|uniref:hypothetical protein n=1 Tax=Agrobacterium tumefaciens TaxID=358 RepID=UPI0021D30322|nr:hypothetical protein [Agrobacterium tumefaciens]UXT53279.1 hypothetical protein FY136_28880 [Agrobacterium tumefaciens]
MNDNGQAIRHEYAPTISPERASEQLRYEIDTFVDTSLQYVQNGREGIAPALAVVAGAGTGKTTAVVEIAAEKQGIVIDLAQAGRKKDATFRIDFNAPTIDLCEEVAEKAQEQGIRTVVRRGRSQPQPGTTPEQKLFMCQRWEAAEKVAAAGMSVTDTLCRQRQEDGSYKECPFYATCKYIAQNEEAKAATLVLASHQYLALEQEGKSQATVQVVDETHWQVLGAERRVPIERFTALRGVGEEFFGNRAERFDSEIDLMASVDALDAIGRKAHREARQPTIEEVTGSKAAVFTEESCRALAKIEYSHINRKAGIKTDMDDVEIIDRVSKLHISDAIGRARVWTCLADEIATGRTGEFNMLRWEYGVLNEKTNELRDYIVCRWRRKPKLEGVPTLIIDADGDERILKKAYPNVEMVYINPAWSSAVRICQDFDFTGSMMALKGERRRDEIYNTALYQAYRLDPQVQAGRLLPEPQNRRVLLVSQKSVIDSYRESDDLENAPFDVAHFGALRGKDIWKYTAGIIVAGRLEPSVDAVENLARAYFGDDIEPFLFIKAVQELREGKMVWVKRFPKRAVVVTPKEGEPRTIMVSYHPDDRCDRILRQIREAELMQAIARVRPVHRSPDNPVDIIVLSNVPLRVQPDAFYQWKQLAADRVTEVELDGWVHETSRGMAEAYPHLWTSATGFRMYMSRRPEVANPGFVDALLRGGLAAALRGRGGVTEPIYNDEIASVTWVRVTFLNGTRAEAGWIRLRSNDTKESIYDRVKSYHPAAHSFDVRMPQPAIVEQPVPVVAGGEKSNVIPFRPRVEPRTGIPYAELSTFTLAWAHSREPRWWEEVREERKNLGDRRRA